MAIAVYNCAQYISQAIESVLSQDYPSLEIVILDDGSTDQTGKILSSFRYQRLVKVFRQKHCGQGCAKDRVIKLCRGRYIALLDADDVVLPQRLKKQADFLDSHPQIGACYGKAKMVDENLNPKMDKMYGREIGIPFKRTWDLIKIPIHPGTLMFRKRLYKKTGGYDHSLTITPDTDFMLKLAEKTKIFFLDEYLILYRRHKSNITHSKEIWKEEAKARRNAIKRRYGVDLKILVS